MPAKRSKTMSPAQRARYYSSLIREAEQKGLQLKEVEEAHGLRPGRLSKWRYEQKGRWRRKKERAASAAAKPEASAAPTFVPVKVVEVLQR